MNGEMWNVLRNRCRLNQGQNQRLTDKKQFWLYVWIEGLNILYRYAVFAGNTDQGVAVFNVINEWRRADGSRFLEWLLIRLVRSRMNCSGRGQRRQ